MLHDRRTTVDGRNPAPVDMVMSHYLRGFKITGGAGLLPSTVLNTKFVSIDVNIMGMAPCHSHHFLEIGWHLGLDLRSHDNIYYTYMYCYSFCNTYTKIICYIYICRDNTVSFHCLRIRWCCSQSLASPGTMTVSLHDCRLYDINRDHKHMRQEKYAVYCINVIIIIFSINTLQMITQSDCVPW